jgi:hypothetical protein
MINNAPFAIAVLMTMALQPAHAQTMADPTNCIGNYAFYLRQKGESHMVRLEREVMKRTGGSHDSGSLRAAGHALRNTKDFRFAQREAMRACGRR